MVSRCRYMNDKEAKCQADLEAALAALKRSNQLLRQSIVARDMQAVERHTVKLAASTWKLAFAVRQCKELMS
jgi:hypothetical protein